MTAPQPWPKATAINLSLVLPLLTVFDCPLPRRLLGRKEEGKDEFLLGEDILTTRGAIKVRTVKFYVERCSGSARV